MPTSLSSERTPQPPANVDDAHARRVRAWPRVALLFGGFVALATGLLWCDSTPLPAGQSPGALGMCAFPRACYLVNTGGQFPGQCDDCRGGPAGCKRLLFTSSDMGPNYGNFSVGSGRPMAGDQAAVCGLYKPAQGDQQPVCAAPEMVCVGRGPRCDGATSFCVRAGQSCSSGTQIAPERRPGQDDGGGITACPYTDDVCCPRATDGGAADASITDGSAGDAQPAG